jgi:hypothetical protein
MMVGKTHALPYPIDPDWYAWFSLVVKPGTSVLLRARTLLKGEEKHAVFTA